MAASSGLFAPRADCRRYSENASLWLLPHTGHHALFTEHGLASSNRTTFALPAVSRGHLKLVPAISLITALAAIPLAGISIWSALRSGEVAEQTTGVIREEQLGSYHAEQIATAILDCRRYEQGLLLAGPDLDGRELHLAGFLVHWQILDDRLQVYLSSGPRDTCLVWQAEAMVEYRTAVLQVAGRLHLANDLDSVRQIDIELEPCKRLMRAAAVCASDAACAHSDMLDREVIHLTQALRRDQAIAFVAGISSFLLLAFGISMLVIPTSKRARRLAEVARKLSNGERDLDCRVGGDDELAHAGEALERMRCLVAERENTLVRREAEARKLAAIIERTALPTFVVDAGGEVVWSNRAAGGRGQYGVPSRAFERTLREAGYKESDVLRAVGSINSGTPFSCGRVETGKEGESRWFRLDGYPVLDESGHVASHVIIERDVSDARRIAASREAFVGMLSQIFGDAPLNEVLDSFALHLESNLPGMQISVHVLEGQHLHVAAAPSISPTLSRLTEGLQIGPDIASCGSCAFTGLPVIATDTLTHPAWARYRGIVETMEVRACWSLPIRSPTGELLGTIAAYSKSPRSPSEADLAMLQIGAGFAGLALGRRRAENHGQQTLLELEEVKAELDRRRRDDAAVRQRHAREIGASIIELLTALRSPGSGVGKSDGDLIRLLEDSIDATVALPVTDRSWGSPLALFHESIARASEEPERHGPAGLRGANDVRDPPGLPALVLIDHERVRMVLSHVIRVMRETVRRPHDAPTGNAGWAVRTSVVMSCTRQRSRALRGAGSSHRLQVEIRGALPRREGEISGGGPDSVDFCLANRVVQRLGGELSVWSDGGDRVVRIELACDALACEPTGAERDTSEDRENRGADRHEDGIHAPVRGRILVVDDHADIRALLVHHLRSAGAEVDDCSSSIGALERMTRPSDGRGYDLVLLDMQLPEHDGYAIATIARASGCGVPIVAVTAHAVGDERARCLKAGCDDLITKPLTREELLEVVRRHLPERAEVR
jgi:CheY-like chemotaxis protein/GAF domain-containing protein